ncbi:tRNA (N6-threonylcarbamoyladenosine(37)-N6)-methyltransferase TrmO [Selenihalanaerobacter shriftii]|uniref:tRNA-Thr(GGU) m(6)t(6)A37 methyltransferase TsaA n=1 Tax=Selenihalanaerobacter shriftii TaxID=142842 RepID=A0A1T4K1L5_9FIRM|nr:tRNA (N6-threonylcarbamoyladenosine(37)-N6)-methyltransferase TrmO [Selenihalanaerobacter shriftii]SJZ36195.1 tRNA-Thr(GGU) m(6)t(6)A37 methyltransferase TsaA [Selenihalanaerobacter shriftii]
MSKFNFIGMVRSKFKEPIDPKEMRKEESTIVINPKYVEGLDGIAENDYLQILFYFHLSEGYELKGARSYGKPRGVFASRSSRRPSPIGVTTVELLERRDNELVVKGLDAIDGTPILDIKPYTAIMDDAQKNIEEELKKNPKTT